MVGLTRSCHPFGASSTRKRRRTSKLGLCICIGAAGLSISSLLSQCFIWPSHSAIASSLVAADRIPYTLSPGDLHSLGVASAPRPLTPRYRLRGDVASSVLLRSIGCLALLVATSRYGAFSSRGTRWHGKPSKVFSVRLYPTTNFLQSSSAAPAQCFSATCESEAPQRLPLSHFPNPATWIGTSVDDAVALSSGTEDCTAPESKRRLGAARRAGGSRHPSCRSRSSTASARRAVRAARRRTGAKLQRQQRRQSWSPIQALPFDASLARVQIQRGLLSRSYARSGPARRAARGLVGNDFANAWIETVATRCCTEEEDGKTEKNKK